MIKHNDLLPDFQPDPFEEKTSGQELFTPDGHLTERAFSLLIEEKLDSMQSLEVSEHLSFCDRCLEQYTAILCGEDTVALDMTGSMPPDVHLIEPPASLHDSIMQKIQQKTNVFYFKKAASLAVAACLTFVFWSGGAFSGKHITNRVNDLLDGLQSSSKTILEQTGEISESINDFFQSLQHGFHQHK